MNNAGQILHDKNNSADETVIPCVSKKNMCLEQSKQSAKSAKHQNEMKKLGANCENPPIKCCDSFEIYNILKVEHANLRQAYIELEAKRCVEVAKLENEIRKFKMDADNQKQHIKQLLGKVYKQQKTGESLKSLLKDLKARSILSTEAYNILEVLQHFSKCAIECGFF